MSDKKDLTVVNVLTEIDQVRLDMIKLYDDIMASEGGDKKLHDLIHEKWVERIPSYILEKFNIPKSTKQYAKEQADKMFKEDIIDDMTNDSDDYFDYDAYNYGI